jgi:kynureninase
VGRAGDAFPTLRLDEQYARELDAQDPLASLREEFALPTRSDGQRIVYLCGNSLGLMPKAARELVQRELDDWSTMGVDAHFHGRAPWYTYHERFREAGARLVGARPSEIVIMNSLTVNLHLMMVSFYRPGDTRNKVLMEEHAFPSDRYAVASQATFHGLSPAEAVVVASARAGESTLRTDDILDLLKKRGDEIALVLLGGVNYLSGQRFEMGRITDAASAAGCVVGLDLAHAIGNVPLHLHEWGVDFAVWCSYKYLNAGPGAAGGCFVHERHAGSVRLPRFAGWWGNDPETRFLMGEEFVPAEGADGWQVSNPSILAMAPLEASLELFDRVGLEALCAKSVQLTGYLECLVQSIDSPRLDIITPRDPDSRGCQLSIRVVERPDEVMRALSERGVVVDFREPDVIRAAPVPFYNTFQDVWMFAVTLADAVGSDALRRGS